MNKVGLSLSILSLCGFLSTAGWAGEFVSNNSLCCLSKKATSNNTSTTPNSQPTPDSQPIVIIPPSSNPAATCGQKTTITDGKGQVTTIETTCKQRSTNY